jgi:cysteine sulfinate desulfinase/cysteine desulfurase-like protein
MTDENLNQNNNNSEDFNKINGNQEKEENPKKKPIRFIFGHDTTEEDIERFLDMIFEEGKQKNQNDK